MVPTTVQFATNRIPVGESFGPPPEQTSFESVAYGHVLVSASPQPYYLGQLLSGQTLYDSSNLDALKTPQPDPYLVNFLMAWLRSAKAQQATPLLFFHGFNYTFSEAIVATGDIVACYGADSAAIKLCPLVFSFPTHLDISAYVRDRVNAGNSGAAIARLLESLTAAWIDAARPDMMLLAHSMGCYALESGCKSLGTVKPPMQSMFRQAVVAAADVTRNAFEPGQGLRTLCDLARWVTVGINDDDLITRDVANWTEDAFPRLACAGPTDAASLPPNVRVVDYVNVIPFNPIAPGNAMPVPPRAFGWDYVSHGYFHTVPAVRADLAHVFADIAPDEVPNRRRGRDGEDGENQSWLYAVRPRTA